MSSQTSVMNLEALRHEYDALVPIAEKLCAELVNQLDQLLAEARVALGFPIQHRVKEWESLQTKLDRLKFPIKDMRNIQDLVGLRITLLFERDVVRVAKLIRETFIVKRHYDTRGRLEPDQFGYSSVHFVVEVPDEWLKLPTLKETHGLSCEIQVRTLAQHIWAEASHKLQYKQEESVPPTLRRSIYRVSALLETVDLEFERVLQERDSYRATLNASGTDEELNVDLLEKTLDLLLPQSNKDPVAEEYAELLMEASDRGVRTQGQLIGLIERHLREAQTDDSRLVEGKLRELRETGRLDPRDGPETLERLRQGVFLNHSGLVRRILRLEIG